jgi:glucosamine-6-phosphate deaminase
MKPRIWRFDNANALTYALLDEVASTVRPVAESGRSPVLALPTGNTMVPFYHLASESAERLRVADWTCFNLDEYHPLPDRDAPYSFRGYLERQFFSKLKQRPRTVHFIDGTSADPEAECASFEERIREAGGIDLAILGIGVNGHIAFNEPGSSFDSRTRPVTLHPETLMANFKGPAPVSRALTLGIGTLLSAKRIFILAIGKSKASAVRAATEEPPTKSLPASALQSHPEVTWFLDQEAADLL